MSNLSRLQQSLKQAGVPAMVLSDIGNVQWATGFTGSFGFAIVTPDGGRFITDSRYTAQAEDQVKELPVVSYGSPRTSDEVLAETVKSMGIDDLRFEESLRYGTYDQWRSKLNGTSLKSQKDLVGPLRMIKTDDELAKMRTACKLADAAFEHALRVIRPGVSEWDVALEIEFFFRRQGADVAFDSIVASGVRSALPHGRASQKIIEHGDFVTLDYGAKVEGYCSDITRTIVVGEVSDRQRELYEQVLAAQVAAIEMMKPGVIAHDVDARAREVLDQKGFAKYFGHGLGHGLGALVHDFGRLGQGAKDALVAGQVDYMCDQIVNAVPQINAGTIKAYAVATPERNPSLPNVPTTAEAGLPTVLSDNWYGLAAPAGVPAPILERVHAATVKALGQMDIADPMIAQGALIRPMTPAEFADFIRQERDKWGPVVKASPRLRKTIACNKA